MNCLPDLRLAGRTCHILEVDRLGLVKAEGLEDLVGPGRSLVSIILANNEIGTFQDLGSLGKIFKAREALFHSDATQGLRSGPIDVDALGLDALSLSGHKIYGPQGIGALYLRRGLKVSPRALGGGQEHHRRSGTVPVALAVGLGTACEVAAARCQEDSARLAAGTDRLYAAIKEFWPAAKRNGAAHAMPGCLHISLPGIDAADLLLDLPDLALATGSALRNRVCGSVSCLAGDWFDRRGSTWQPAHRHWALYDFRRPRLCDFPPWASASIERPSRAAVISWRQISII